MSRVLAIDPGSQKCGVAVVSPEQVLHKAVVPREGIGDVISELAAKYDVDKILLGNGTGSENLAELLHGISLTVPLEIVEEAFSTIRARKRYFRDNPPRGLKRLIPQGLLTPDQPYDDQVAVIIAEDYLVGRQK